MRVLAFSYKRFSNPNQAKGASLERQGDAAREWAERNGAELDESLVDRGLSGYTGANRKKGDLGRFIEAAKIGRVPRGSFLLIDDMSRLSRMPQADAAGQLLDIVRLGIKVVTLNDGAVLDEQATMTDMIVAILKIQGAHDYSKELGRKVADGHARAKEKARAEKRAYSKKGPGWLKLADDRSHWICLPERVEVVKRIVELADVQGMGSTAIAMRLNAEKELTFQGGPIWHGTTVQKILRSQALLGHFQPRYADGSPHGDLALGYFGAAIIDEATWYRVQARMDQSRSRQGKRPSSNEVRNLCYGLTRCAHCDHVMTVQRRSKDKVDVIHCYGMHQGACDNRTRWHVKRFEAALIFNVQELDLTMETRESEARRGLAIAEGKREELLSRIANLYDRMEEGDDLAAGRLKARRIELAEVEAAIAEAKRAVELSGFAQSPADHQGAVQALWGKLETAEGTELYDLRARIATSVQELFEGIVFHKSGHIELRSRTGSVRFMSGLAIGKPGPSWAPLKRAA